MLFRSAYTAVDGEKVTMNVGDFVITPSWCFHDHGNPSNETMVWMDGLDIGLVEMLDAQFMEKGAEEIQHVDRTEGDNLAQFGNTMKPVEYKARSKTSPLFWYPYGRTREALETMRKSGEIHAHWGHKLQYTNPVTGGWAMPTIGTFMQLLPKGFKGFEEPAHWLTFDEIERLLGVFARLGTSRIRLTGGEPGQGAFTQHEPMPPTAGLARDHRREIGRAHV